MQKIDIEACEECGARGYPFIDVHGPEYGHFIFIQCRECGHVIDMKKDSKLCDQSSISC